MEFLKESLKWICDNYPSVGVVVLFSGCLIYITLAIRKVFDRLVKVEQIGTSNKASIDTTINPKLEKIEKSIANIDKGLNALVLYLKTKDSNVDPQLFISRSPIQLTELGSEILNAMKGSGYIDSNLPKLISELELKAPQTALDVQANAEIVLFNCSTLPEFSDIKNYLYKNPVYRKEDDAKTEIKLDLSVAIDLMAIYLRNKYLEKYPALNVD
jgi:hypothetical protein